MSGETYKIAVMRNPVEHIQSVFQTLFTQRRHLNHRLNKKDEQLKRFVANPGLYLETIKNETKLFDPVFYLIRNGMADIF